MAGVVQANLTFNSLFHSSSPSVSFCAMKSSYTSRIISQPHDPTPLSGSGLIDERELIFKFFFLIFIIIFFYKIQSLITNSDIYRCSFYSCHRFASIFQLFLETCKSESMKSNLAIRQFHCSSFNIRRSLHNRQIVVSGNRRTRMIVKSRIENFNLLYQLSMI